jgi:hypothetical protein
LGGGAELRDGGICGDEGELGFGGLGHGSLVADQNPKVVARVKKLDAMCCAKGL